VKKLSLLKKCAVLFSAATILTATGLVSLNANVYAHAQQDAAPQSEAQLSDSAQTVYPDNFSSDLTFSSLADYAISGSTYAFAQGTNVYIINTDTEKESPSLVNLDCGFEIKNLEYLSDVLYLGDADGNAYLIDGTSSQSQISFETENPVKAGDNTYYLTNDGALYFIGGGNLLQIGEDYSHLKTYNNLAYAIKNNEIVKIDGTSTQTLTFSYTDYSAASTIAVGTAYEALKATYTVATVNVESGAYCTEINLNTAQGTYFNAVKTFKLSGAKSALLLATTGNASIIAMNDGDEVKSYITKSSYLSATTYKDVDADMTGGYVVSDVGVYSSPYISEATKITTIKQATVVEITQKFSLSFMGTDYYKINYTNEQGQKVSGYIPASFLTPYTFAAERAEEETISGDFDYSTNVERVILVLIIVGLVIVAIAYLTVIGTRPRNKTNKSPAKQSPSRQITQPNQYNNKYNNQYNNYNNNYNNQNDNQYNNQYPTPDE
jgi:hypothetical protein